jgi:multisubunit Na+/H+ antiporter MnhC subunit
MSGLEITAIVIGVLLLALILMNMRDLWRYIKISSM